MDKKEKITVGWIDSGLVNSGFIAHLSNILLGRPERITDVVVASGPYVSLNRNRMVQLFLNTKSEWLLSLDSDVCITIDTFDKLVGAANSVTHPVMGGKYYVPFNDGKNIVIGAQKWVDRTDPHALGEWLTPQDIAQAITDGNHIIEKIHSTGIGFTLIHREVFLAIQTLNQGISFPWFDDSYSKEWDTWTSDDIHFWEQCRILDINISINIEAVSDHLKQFKLNDDVYLMANPDIHQHEPNIGHSMPHRRTSWWAGRKKNK